MKKEDFEDDSLEIKFCKNALLWTCKKENFDKPSSFPHFHEYYLV